MQHKLMLIYIAAVMWLFVRLFNKASMQSSHITKYYKNDSQTSILQYTLLNAPPPPWSLTVGKGIEYGRIIKG